MSHDSARCGAVWPVWRALPLYGAQAPTPERTSAAIEMSRKVALDYARSLPDFICTQLVDRYVDFDHSTQRVSWRWVDTLTIKLKLLHKEKITPWF